MMDVIEHGRAAIDYASNVSLDRFLDDRLLRDAAERRLMAATEAVVQYAKASNPDRLSESKAIIAFRNMMVHQYWSVDPAIVHRIIQESLPRLVAEALAIATEEEAGGTGIASAMPAPPCAMAPALSAIAFP